MAHSKYGGDTRIDISRLSKDLGSVTRAGRILGFGWSNSPRLRGHGEDPATTLQHYLPRALEAAIVEMSLEQPQWGPVRMTNELFRRGISVTVHDIQHVWRLHDLEVWSKRGQAAAKSQATLRIMQSAKGARRRRFRLPWVEIMALLTVVGMFVATAKLYQTLF